MENNNLPNWWLQRDMFDPAKAAVFVFSTWTQTDRSLGTIVEDPNGTFTFYGSSAVVYSNGTESEYDFVRRVIPLLFNENGYKKPERATDPNIMELFLEAPNSQLVLWWTSHEMFTNESPILSASPH